MNSETVLNKVFQELNHFYDDIKAESVLLELLKQSSIKPDDVIVKCKGVFRRGYRRDILDISKTENEKILLTLSRLGIYDSLPEGFFHKEQNLQGNYNKDRQIRKKEERDARLFFSPIENELFNQRVQISKKEQELIDNFYNLNTDFLLRFWKLKKYRDNKYIAQLVKLLPHTYKIAGDLNLIKYCLEKILNEKVELIKKFKSETIPAQDNSSTLGVNFISSVKENNIATPVLEIKIGPLSNKKLNDYHENREMLKFLELFYSYFLSLELKVETKFFNDKKENFILDEKEKPIMGVSTKI